MTNQTIENLINRLNNEDTSEIIFRRAIGKNVEYAYVWNNAPSFEDPIEDTYDPYHFFFIRNEKNKYAAAVLFMGNDLHWFVLPTERKKALLTTAMQEYIISYLFDLLDEKPIRITIDKGSEFEKESLRVAQLLNFKPGMEDGEYILTMADVDWSKDKMKEVNGQLDEKRMSMLRHRFQYHLKSLYMLNHEVQSIFGYDESVTENLENLRSYNYRIKDLYDDQF
jgi:hypothetical protein